MLFFFIVFDLIFVNVVDFWFYKEICFNELVGFYFYVDGIKGWVGNGRVFVRGK